MLLEALSLKPSQSSFFNALQAVFLPGQTPKAVFTRTPCATPTCIHSQPFFRLSLPPSHDRCSACELLDLVICYLSPLFT